MRSFKIHFSKMGDKKKRLHQANKCIEFFIVINQDINP